jgi:hypothetical protein
VQLTYFLLHPDFLAVTYNYLLSLLPYFIVNISVIITIKSMLRFLNNLIFLIILINHIHIFFVTKLTPWKHSPSWEADSRSGSKKKIPVFYGTRRLMTAFQGFSQLGLILSHINRTHISTPMSFKISFTAIFLSSLQLSFSSQIIIATFILMYIHLRHRIIVSLKHVPLQSSTVESYNPPMRSASVSSHTNTTGR